MFTRTRKSNIRTRRSNVPMSTIITLGTYTQSKYSKAFDAKSNLKVICAKKMGLISKRGCMSVTDLNQTVRYTCHVVDV